MVNYRTMCWGRLSASVLAAMSFGCASGFAGNLQPPPKLWTMSFQEAMQHGGVYIPSKAARQMVLGYISREPVALFAAETINAQSPGRPALLKTSGRVALASGLVLGDEGREHVRLGDTITSGVIQNTDTRTIRLTLGDGTIVRLDPGQGIYVGPYGLYDPAHPDRRPKVETITHGIVCACTCSVDPGPSQEITLACGATCLPDGNQCLGLDGTECRFDPDGDGPEQLVTGIASDCHEVLVPVEAGVSADPTPESHGNPMRR